MQLKKKKKEKLQIAENGWNHHQRECVPLQISPEIQLRVFPRKITRYYRRRVTVAKIINSNDLETSQSHEQPLSLRCAIAGKPPPHPSPVKLSQNLELGKSR